MARTSKEIGGYEKSLYKTPIYRTWFNMKTRCLNKNYKDFHRYGGRGIAVCDKWLNFSGFYDDMGPSYVIGLTLDRINNDGNYEPDNCRWTSVREQANNRSSNTFLEYKGVKKTFAELCRTSNVKPSTVRQRYYAYGWSLGESLYR